MEKDQEKMASENHGDAATCGPSPGPGCWPLPSEWDRFIPPSAINIVCERVREEIGGGTLTRPVWNQEWLRGLEAFIRSIAQDEIRKANPGGGRTAPPPCSAASLPSGFCISPNPEDLALRALGAGFHIEARQLGISSERLLAMLIRALPNTERRGASSRPSDADGSEGE